MLYRVQEPNLMNLSYVADLPAAGSNLNIKEKFESEIQIWTGGRQIKIIKYCPWSI